MAVAGLAVVSAALVAVGRWEQQREVRAEVRGIERVAARIGPLDAPSLSGFRRLRTMDCLTYRRGANALALELCADPAGRVVEAIDRTDPERRIATLRFDRSASTVRIDRALVDRLLRRMAAGA